jgi:HAD superfamily hydrolase (TIGR01509 family)
MLGMSSLEWSRYVAEELRVPLAPPDISQRVVDHVLRRYDEALPLLPGAEEAVARLAARWPLALASSSNKEVIDHVMAASGWDRVFREWVSSEEVARGKPSPDVFLEAAGRIGVDPAEAAGIEDSHNGILAARAAGLRTIAVPNHETRCLARHRERRPTRCRGPSSGARGTWRPTGSTCAQRLRSSG